MSGRHKGSGTIPWPLKRDIILLSAGLGTAIALVTAVVHWIPARGAPAPQRLLIFVFTATLSGFLVLLENRHGRSRWTLYTPWAIYGALLASIAVGPISLAPWLLASTACFAIAALVAGFGGFTGLAARTGLAFAAALSSFAFLWLPMTASGHRISAAEFAALELQTDSILNGLNLHDAWVVHLPGGGPGRTLEDIRNVALSTGPTDVSTIVAALIGIRVALGQALNLDEAPYLAPASSYTQLLTASGLPALPAATSSASPAIFRPVHSLENEAVIEMSNRTGHAYIAAVLRPVENGGYDLYWGIYVEKTGWLTPLYMGLVDPFRRHIVYPATLSGIKRAWQGRFGEV